MDNTKQISLTPEALENPFENLVLSQVESMIREAKNDRSKIETALEKLSLAKVIEDNLTYLRENLKAPSFTSREELLRFNQKLVHVKLFIQDIFDPEMFASGFYDGENNLKVTKYCDQVSDTNFVGIAEDSIVFSERTSCFCLIQECENDSWFGRINEQNSESNRYLEELNKALAFKKLRFSKTPILLKVYEDFSSKLKVNQCIEVIGILRLEKEGIQASNKPTEEEGISDQTLVYPLDLVPRLHCLWVKGCDNTVIPKSPETVSTSVKALRELFIKSLSPIFGGDELATELYLLSLLSDNLIRPSTEVLGRFVLNFTNADQILKVETSTEAKEITFPNVLKRLAEQLVPYSKLIRVTLDSLQKGSFLPKKNYVIGALEGGELQIPAKTHLVVDETEMKAGNLNETGIKNVLYLKKFFTDARLDLLFDYFEMGVDSDFSIVITSSGPSFLYREFTYKLGEITKTSIQDAWIGYLLFSQSNDVKNEEFEKKINELRDYISFVKELFRKMTLSNEITAHIQKAYVDARKTGKDIGTEHLNRWIHTAKIRAASFGLNDVNPDLYDESVNLCSKLF